MVFVVPPSRMTREAHIPYGVGILANICDSLGYYVSIIDCTLDPIFEVDAVRKALTSEDDWDVISVGGMSAQYKYIKQIVPAARKMFPQSTIITGGGFLTSMPDEAMQLLPDIDVGCIGEAEETLPELLTKINNRQWDNVKGIIYRDTDKKLTRTPPRPLIKDLDKLPYPAFDLLPMEQYFQRSPLELSMAAIMSKRRISLITERGCTRNCTFCTHLGMSTRDLCKIYDTDITGPYVRFHSAKYVVDLIKHLRMKYAIDFVSFLDENFMSNPKRAYEICTLLEEAGLTDIIRWGCLGDVDCANYDLLQRMRDCGNTYVSYGGESASAKMLKSIGKEWQTSEMMEKAVNETFRAETNPVMSFMCGYPDETVDDILLTIEFWMKTDYHAKPFFITPYPNTELFKKYKKRILDQHRIGNESDLKALDNFLSKLGDATDLAANISPWDDPTLLGLRELATNREMERIRRWAKAKGLPVTVCD